MGRSRLGVRGVAMGSMAVLLGFAIGGIAHAQAQPASQPTLAVYAPPSHSETLFTTFVDWDALAVRQIPQGLSRPIFDNPSPDLEKIEVHSTTLNPGQTLHSPHHHAWEEMCLVKEGEVQVQINGVKHRAGPGFLAFFASHDPHSIENVSDKPVTYYVMNICTPLIHTTSDKPASEQNVPGKLPSSVFDCNSAPATPNATGSLAIVFDSATLTFPNLSSHITTLNANQSTRADQVDSADELFFIKTGLVEVTINGISCRLKEGSLFYCAPNDKRTLKNIGTTPAAYQVIRASLRPARGS